MSQAAVGAAFGAEAAVEADVFVFDHDACGLRAASMRQLRSLLGGLLGPGLSSQPFEIGSLLVVRHVHDIAAYFVADVTHHFYAVEILFFFLDRLFHNSNTSFGVLISSIG